MWLCVTVFSLCARTYVCLRKCDPIMHTVMHTYTYKCVRACLCMSVGLVGRLRALYPCLRIYKFINVHNLHFVSQGLSTLDFGMPVKTFPTSVSLVNHMYFILCIALSRRVHVSSYLCLHKQPEEYNIRLHCKSRLTDSRSAA